jgi:hypothetical protein
MSKTMMSDNKAEDCTKPSLGTNALMLRIDKIPPSNEKTIIKYNEPVKSPPRFLLFGRNRIIVFGRPRLVKVEISVPKLTIDTAKPTSCVANK